MYRGDKGEEIFKIIENMSIDDIVFEENPNVYYQGDYGYILKICGRTDIAKWRRGQFSIPDSDDIYIYACMGHNRYYSLGCIENYKTLQDAKRHLFNLLKYKLRNSEKFFQQLQEKIQKRSQNFT